MRQSFPLRIMIPVTLSLLCVLMTSAGYLLVYNQMQVSIKAAAGSETKLELNKLQLLVEDALHKNNLPLIEQLHAVKSVEDDLTDLIIVSPEQTIIAAIQLSQLNKSWQTAKTNINHQLANQVMTERSFFVDADDAAGKINGYTSLCPDAFSFDHCGFIYYQLNLEQRYQTGLSWLQKQIFYIASASVIGIIILVIALSLIVTRRVAHLQDVLVRWGKGERHIRVELSGRDELADIAENVNELLSQFAEDEESLIYNQQLTDAVIQSANYSMITTDINGIITSMNATAQRMLGYNEYELKELKTPGIFHDRDEVIQRARELSEELNEIIDPGFESFVAKARRGGIDEHNWTYIRKGGTRFKVRLSVSAILNHDGELRGFLGIAHDISEELKTAEKLENMAYFDQLTQLPNRVLYRDRLEQAILQAKRIESQVAVLFLDLDKFKFVNDSYGHEIGDRLLVEVAKILRQHTRDSDTVCRLGGDEFTIILSNVHERHQQRDISRICEKIIEAIYQPIIIDDKEISIGVSIGIAVYPHDGTSIPKLNKAADLAMYAAKDAGRGCYHIYSPELDLEQKK